MLRLLKERFDADAAHPAKQKKAPAAGAGGGAAKAQLDPRTGRMRVADLLAAVLAAVVAGEAGASKRARKGAAPPTVAEVEEVLSSLMEAGRVRPVDDKGKYVALPLP